jgi:hypothetical protein
MSKREGERVRGRDERFRGMRVETEVFFLFNTLQF